MFLDRLEVHNNTMITHMAHMTPHILDSHGTYTLKNIYSLDSRIILFFQKCSRGFMSNHPKMPQGF